MEVEIDYPSPLVDKGHLESDIYWQINATLMYYPVAASDSAAPCVKRHHIKLNAETRGYKI